MANREIDCFEQFLRLSQCFQKRSAAEATERIEQLIKNQIYQINCNYTVKYL